MRQRTFNSTSLDRDDLFAIVYGVLAVAFKPGRQALQAVRVAACKNSRRSITLLSPISKRSEPKGDDKASLSDVLQCET